eukprot:4970554-Prymnesium_polylepis.1
MLSSNFVAVVHQEEIEARAPLVQPGEGKPSRLVDVHKARGTRSRLEGARPAHSVVAKGRLEGIDCYM